MFAVCYHDGLTNGNFKIKMAILFHVSQNIDFRKRGGSVIEHRTPERQVGGSKPTSAVLCPWVRHFNNRCIVHRNVSVMCYKLSLVVRKPVFGVSDQVRHKPGCAATEDG